MLYRVTLPLVATLAFGAVPALAATVGQATAPANTTNQASMPAATANQAIVPDLAGFEQAKVTLDQAIAAAEKQSGGKAMDATFQNMGANSGYAVTVLADGRMKVLWVDPQSGLATPEAKMLSAEANQKALSDLNGAKTSLPQAISMAEQRTGGRAIDAWIVKHSDKYAYDIRLLRDGKLSTLWVDPDSGEISG
jgi:uncharacterized membrane protein YkoI